MIGTFPEHFYWGLLVLLAITFPFIFSILVGAVKADLTDGVGMLEGIGNGFIVGLFGSGAFFLYLMVIYEGSNSYSHSPDKLRDTILIVGTTLLSGLTTALTISLYAKYLNAPSNRKS